MAAVDYFLTIEGVPGESKDPKYKGGIDALGYSWGMSQSGTAHVVGGGGGVGKPELEDLIVVARTSKASPLLMLACASGQHLKSAVLTCRHGGPKPREFLHLELEDVLISSYEVGGSEDEFPSEEISLTYAKITFTYLPVSKTGKPQAPVTGGWDLKKNAKV
jgi:type VI secretion system secreted protein Hcp